MLQIYLVTRRYNNSSLSTFSQTVIHCIDKPSCPASSESSFPWLVYADHSNVKQQCLINVAGVAEDEVERSVTRKGGRLGSHDIMTAVILRVAKLYGGVGWGGVG